MRIIFTLQNAAKLSIALGLLFCGTALKAQSPCGDPQGSICSQSCGGSYPTACAWNSQGSGYCVNAYVNCGSCGAGNYVIYNSSGCNINGLSRHAIRGLVAAANGKDVLTPACGGGFKPLVEGPLAVAEEHWTLPKNLPIVR